MQFATFLKRFDEALFKEYAVEKFFKKDDKPDSEYQPPPEPIFTPKAGRLEDILIRCDLLQDNSTAIQYLKSRQIDEKFWSKIFFCKDLNIIKSYFPQYEDPFFVEERLVIPVYKDMELTGVISRSLNPSSRLRYLNLKREDNNLVYDLNTIDRSKPIFVVEGIFDKFFLNNSLACNMLDFSIAFPYIDIEKDILVYDNTPRNKSLIKQLDKSCDLGYKICIWPEWIKGKDINEMIVSGEIEKDKIEDLIIENTFSGLPLKFKIQTWKKIN